MPFVLAAVLAGFLYLFLLPANVFGALTLADISPLEIDSSDDIITISASASGLSSAMQYLQAAFTKEGSETNYLGLTKNDSGEWYPYKSSPTVADLTNYFYRFTPVNATWSGKIQAKIDVDDDGFLGPGNYTVKLFKYISSSGTVSNNSLIIGVNVATPSSQSTVSTQISKSSTITFSLGNLYGLGDIFGLQLDLWDFVPLTEYFLKIRGGLEENTLNQVQTQNGTNLLGDTESWSNFPLIKTNPFGSWSGELKGQVSEDQDAGKYKLRVRVHRRDTDTSVDSELREVEFTKHLADITIAAQITAATDDLSPVNFLDEEATAEEDLLNFPDILGLESTISPGSTRTPSVKKTAARNQTETTTLPLFVTGAIATCLALLLLTFRKLRS